MEVSDINVLIACEESQAICLEFRKRGFNAFSCDLLPCSGGHPEWHFQKDVKEVYDMMKWHIVIAHPPCTFLSISGNRWYDVSKYGDKALKRIKDREEAKKFFMYFTEIDCEHVVIENPVGVMSTEYRKADQIINPYQFGDPFEKKTCLWIKGLPLLKETNVIEPPPRVKFGSGKSMPSWYADAWKLPEKERQKLRSKTFPGIASAIAEQYGEFLINKYI